MNDTDTTHRHGRRARRLSPEEAAAVENLTAAEITGELDAIPSVRGAVPAPGADAPIPKLRKFGRRARIIELTDEEQPAPAAPFSSAEQADVAAQTDAVARDGVIAEVPEADSAEDIIEPVSQSRAGGGEGATSPGTAVTAAPNRPRVAETIERDRDGVELGELSVTEAPHPKPAPRFDGKVLHRPERSGGRPLLWVVWGLVALALIVLIALLLTGVIGTGADSASIAEAARLSADLIGGSLDPTIARPIVEDLPA